MSIFNNMDKWKVQFVKIWTGQAVSLLTSSVLQMASVWYLTERTGSSAVLSFATLIGFLPQAVLGTFIGVFIDRYSRKKIMICADLFIAAASLILVAVGMFGEIPIWLIMIVLFVRSIGSAFLEFVRLKKKRTVYPKIMLPAKEILRAFKKAVTIASNSIIWESMGPMWVSLDPRTAASASLVCERGQQKRREVGEGR